VALDDRVVLVTGATGVLGRMVAERFAAAARASAWLAPTWPG
jgi:NAD(P)-dependent dehydrogenase (short-subunit alcohol dehydrogenase family)